jgi:hypothetical protein
MPAKGEHRPWARMVALAVAAVVLVAFGALVARALDRPPGGEKCDPQSSSLEPHICP